MLSASLPRKSAGAEKEFLAQVLEMFNAWNPGSADNQLTNWGGWWRNRFRQDAGKAQRVLADVRLLVKEGRILQDPGAAAHDLWKRLP